MVPTGRILMNFDIGVFFEKSIEKIQVSLNYEKNNGYFERRPTYICDDISLNSSWNEKCFR
jgi:hypothetical protein